MKGIKLIAKGNHLIWGGGHLIFKENEFIVVLACSDLFSCFPYLSIASRSEWIPFHNLLDLSSQMNWFLFKIEEVPIRIKWISSLNQLMLFQRQVTMNKFLLNWNKFLTPIIGVLPKSKWSPQSMDNMKIKSFQFKIKMNSLLFKIKWPPPQIKWFPSTINLLPFGNQWLSSTNQWLPLRNQLITSPNLWGSDMVFVWQELKWNEQGTN